VRGQKAVLVEDLISTGGSSLKAAQALRDAGLEVLGMVSIFTYGFDTATRNFYEANTSLISLCDYSSLIKYALDQKYISGDQATSLKAWRVDPVNWKK
jgi:orotate phosphoribosyltransferase